MVGGTRDVTWWKGAEPATWAEEDACDKAKDEAADKSPVKGQVWDGLFYRHWDHYLGAKRSHVLVMDVDGKNARDLTPASVVGDAETPTFFVGGAQNYAWAPDSKEIAYVTNLDKVPAASTNNDVFTLRLDEPGAKAVKVSTSPGSDDEPEYSPDGRWLAFRSQARGGFESDRFRLMLFDREKKTAAEVELKLKSYSSPPMIVKEGSKAPPVSTVTVSERDLDNWVDEFAWATDSQRIFFIAPDRGQEIVYGTNVPSGNLHRYGKITGADTAGEWSSLIQIGPGYRFAGILMRADKPGEVAIANLDEMDDSGFINAQSASARKMYHLREGVPPATPNYLTHLNDAIVSSLDVRPLEPFWSTGAEGTKIEGFLLKPPGFDPAKKYPVKFLMHGGPQTAWGDAWSYRWNWELMAASGYVVIGINRRGSTGYGQKFVDEVSGDWGGRAYEDLMKGLDYAEAKFPFLDETRECALGASYGGFMANWVLTHTNRFKCIVTHDGMFDPVSAYGDTEEMWFNEWEFRRPEDFPKGWDGFAPDPKQTAAGHPAEPWRYASLPADEDPFRRWSPMRFIENAKTPTLIIHSQRDMRLDVGQGMEMFTALQRLGVPSKMLYFPDEGHWVLKPQNSQVWNEVVGDWCDRWTKSGKYAEK
jgi:dipeptidyl aminopeptidase/acylaminoacyl peptidase